MFNATFHVNVCNDANYVTGKPWTLEWEHGYTVDSTPTKPNSLRSFDVLLDEQMFMEDSAANTTGVESYCMGVGCNTTHVRAQMFGSYTNSWNDEPFYLVVTFGAGSEPIIIDPTPPEE